jgi:hypothetical protein
MAHAWTHARNSARRHGGAPEAYMPVHQFLDASKIAYAGPAHRAARHHALGVFEAEERFGITLDNGAGRRVPVRVIAEQHIVEDLGRVPSLGDWVATLPLQPWMLGRDDARGAADADADPDPADLSVERWRAEVGAARTTLGYADWRRWRAGAAVPIRPFLDLSAAHLTTATRELLDDSDPRATPSTMLRGPHGWMVHVASDPSLWRWPEDMAGVLAHARSMSCDYILFDADGPILDALPVHDHEELEP